MDRLKPSASPDREAALKAALAAYQARARANAPAETPASRQAFIADTARTTGLSGAELAQLFARYDRGEGPGLQDHELAAVHAAAQAFLAASELPSKAVDAVAAGVGGTVKLGVDGVGLAASGIFHVMGITQTAGVDLVARGLAAVGAEGAASQLARSSGSVKHVYDAVGSQAGLFCQGVGAALRDTVVGIGSTIAHPIATVEGLAHLVAHPSELPKVAHALWDTATEKGTAYAIGYVAGNVVPALLTGGSSSGGTLTARVAAIAGKSELLTNAGKVLSTAARASRVGGAAIEGYTRVATVAGRATRFASAPLRAAGRVVSESASVQRAAGFVKRLAERAGETPALRAASRLRRAYEDRVVAINDAVDDALRGGLRRAEGSAAGQRLGGRLAARAEGHALERGGGQAALDAAKAAKRAGEARSAEVAGVSRGESAPLTAEERRLLEHHGTDAATVDQLNHAGLDRNPNAHHKDRLVQAHDAERDAALRGLGDRTIDKNRAVYDDREGALARIGDNRVRDGVIYEGARPFGEMPNVRVNFGNQRLAAAMDRARDLAGDATLTAEQKLRRVTDLVRGRGDEPGLLRAASSDPRLTEAFDAINRRAGHAEFRLDNLDTYLDARIPGLPGQGVGDCRHFALTNQTLLQEAVPELNPRVVYTATFEKTRDGAAIAVNHAFNVVTIGGEDVVVDAILPHFTGGKVRDYVNQGIFGREVRFVQDRFQVLDGRWSGGGTIFNTAPGQAAALGELGREQQAD